MATVNAAEWYTDPDLTVTYSRPRLSLAKVTGTLQRWVERQGRAWPTTVTADRLVDGMNCLFVPYVLTSARVSFDWTGKEGASDTRSVSCTFCGGTGRRTEVLSGNVHTSTSCHNCSGSGRRSETYYYSKLVSGSFSNVRVEPHLHDAEGLGQANFTLRCDEPDILAALAQRVPLSNGGEVAVVGAKWKDNDDVAWVAHKATMNALCEKVEKRKVGVRDVRVSQIEYSEREYSIHLYPVFINSYGYGRGTYGVQVDGHSGHVWVGAPLSVRAKRWLLRVSEAVFWFLAIVLGVSYFTVGFRLVTGWIF